MVECKSAQQAAAREEPAVRECKSRQCAVARRREEETINNVLDELIYCHIVVMLYCCFAVLSSQLKKQHGI